MDAPSELNVEPVTPTKNNNEQLVRIAVDLALADPRRSLPSSRGESYAGSDDEEDDDSEGEDESEVPTPEADQSDEVVDGEDAGYDSEAELRTIVPLEEENASEPLKSVIPVLEKKIFSAEMMREIGREMVARAARSTPGKKAKRSRRGGRKNRRSREKAAAAAAAAATVNAAIDGAVLRLEGGDYSSTEDGLMPCLSAPSLSSSTTPSPSMSASPSMSPVHFTEPYRPPRKAAVKMVRSPSLNSAPTHHQPVAIRIIPASEESSKEVFKGNANNSTFRSFSSSSRRRSSQDSKQSPSQKPLAASPSTGGLPPPGPNINRRHSAAPSAELYTPPLRRLTNSPQMTTVPGGGDQPQPFRRNGNVSAPVSPQIGPMQSPQLFRPKNSPGQQSPLPPRAGAGAVPMDDLKLSPSHHQTATQQQSPMQGNRRRSEQYSNGWSRKNDAGGKIPEAPVERQSPNPKPNNNKGPLERQLSNPKTKAPAAGGKKTDGVTEEAEQGQGIERTSSFEAWLYRRQSVVDQAMQAA